MARQRKGFDLQAGELNLTAMIDVAFQLLAFFIITVKPVDVMAVLNVYRPSPPEVTQPGPAQPAMIRIQVLPEGFSINEHPATVEELGELLGRLARIDTTQTVVILCADAAPHERLVQVLDACAKARLSNLSVVSLAG